MATTLSLTRNEIIQAALRRLGEYAPGETLGSSEVNNAAESLNIILKSLDALPDLMWAMKSTEFSLNTTSGVRLYTLDSAVHWIESAVVVVEDSLGSECLTQTDFTLHSNWHTMGDFDDTGAKAVYTDSGGSGKLFQLQTDLNTAFSPGKWYKFAGTLSGVTGDCSAKIETSCASAQITILLVNGALEVYFKMADDVTPTGHEFLSQTDFASYSKWSETGDFDITGGNAAYTHSAGTGVLTQTAANMNATVPGSTWMVFEYTISGSGGSESISIPSTFASSAVTLETGDGTHKILFKTASSPGSFILNATSSGAGGNFTLDDLSLKDATGAFCITVTSTGGGFTLDDVSVKELTGTETILFPITQDEHASLDADSTGTPQFFYMSTDLAVPRIRLWPVPNDVMLVKYWGREKLTTFSSSSDTMDLPEDMYRLVICMLAKDLATEFGAPSAIVEQLAVTTREAIQIASGKMEAPPYGKVE